MINDVISRFVDDAVLFDIKRATDLKWLKTVNEEVALNALCKRML